MVIIFHRQNCCRPLLKPAGLTARLHTAINPKSRARHSVRQPPPSSAIV